MKHTLSCASFVQKNYDNISPRKFKKHLMHTNFNSLLRVKFINIFIEKASVALYHSLNVGILNLLQKKTYMNKMTAHC
jgi:hypothetical protein